MLPAFLFNINTIVADAFAIRSIDSAFIYRLRSRHFELEVNCNMKYHNFLRNIHAVLLAQESFAKQYIYSQFINMKQS